MTSSLGPILSKNEWRVAFISSSERDDASEPRRQNKELGAESFEFDMGLWDVVVLVEFFLQYDTKYDSVKFMLVWTRYL